MRGQPDMTAPPVATSSFLATRRGRLVLVFLCAVGFLDFLDTSIVNVALPSIQRDLHFSTQNLQWVVSGYIVTYGGFLLLGGRIAALLGRRRTLVSGTALFGLASLAGGLAPNAGTLVGAPLVQGLGAALMAPAAPSPPHHQLQLRPRPGEGARRLGRHRRPLVGHRGLPRRRDIGRAGLAVGLLREPARLRGGPGRRVQADRWGSPRSVRTKGI